MVSSPAPQGISRKKRWLRLTAVLVVGATIATAWVMLRGRTVSLPEADAQAAELVPRLRAHVHALAGDIGPRHLHRPAALEAAAVYIEQRLLELDYTVERQRFDAMSREVANIQASPPTLAPTAPYFVVGAHYDTVPGTPGANDNASGVAVLLEVARIIASETALRVRFVAFVNEEPPWFQTPLMGSAVYASRAKEAHAVITGMISLETMGYYSIAPASQQYPAPFHLLFPNTGHFLAAVSNFSSFPLLRGFRRAFKAATPLALISSPAPAGIPGVGWSDHWSFWQQGYSAIMLTDTAPYRYPHYHRTDDTPDKLDYVRLALATGGVAAAIRDLAR